MMNSISVLLEENQSEWKNLCGEIVSGSLNFLRPAPGNDLAMSLWHRICQYQVRLFWHHPNLAAQITAKCCGVGWFVPMTALREPIILKGDVSESHKIPASWLLGCCCLHLSLIQSACCPPAFLASHLFQRGKERTRTGSIYEGEDGLDTNSQNPIISLWEWNRLGKFICFSPFWFDVRAEDETERGQSMKWGRRRNYKCECEIYDELIRVNLPRQEIMAGSQWKTLDWLCFCLQCWAGRHLSFHVFRNLGHCGELTICFSAWRKWKPWGFAQAAPSTANP